MTRTWADAPAVLPTESTVAARRRVSAIRNALATADALLAEAYAARDWATLGHPSWAAYCKAELPELAHIKLRAEVREARTRALLAARPDASVRDLAAASGCGVATMQATLEAIRGLPEIDRALPASTVPKLRRVLEVLAAADRPLTFAEVVKRSKLPRHTVVPALSRLSSTGRVVYDPPARRGLIGSYRMP